MTRIAPTGRKCSTTWLPLVVDAAGDAIQPGTFFDVYPQTRFAKAEALYTPNYRTTKAKRNPFNCENVACEPIYPWGLMGVDSPRQQLDRMRDTFLERPRAVLGFRQRLGSQRHLGGTAGYARSNAAESDAVRVGAQMFPNGMPGTPGNCPKEWGKVLGDSPGFDPAGVLATAVQEMQLRSCGGKIWVFPSWPKGWRAEFTLAAEGGLKIAARIGKNGEIPGINIFSRLGGCLQRRKSLAGRCRAPRQGR